MWIDDAGKEKILLETDPEKIIHNFENYTGKKLAPLENLRGEETQLMLLMIKRFTRTYIKYQQGESKPFAEVAIKLQKDIKEKYLSEELHNNNRRRCRKGSS